MQIRQAERTEFDAVRRAFTTRSSTPWRARQTGMHLMRLDVLKGNLPAEKLYPACGFRCVDTVTMYYGDTGWTDFEMYEYVV